MGRPDYTTDAPSKPSPPNSPAIFAAAIPSPEDPLAALIRAAVSATYACIGVPQPLTLPHGLRARLGSRVLGMARSSSDGVVLDLETGKDPPAVGYRPGRGRA